jgi:two-component system, OmpR family, response regulator
MQLSRILLIEDDRSIASALTQALQTSHHLTVTRSGALALRKAEKNRYDAIILDLGLPDMDGLAVCKQLREQGVTAPLLILTANEKVLSKIHLLDAGADDYLVKPFSLGELKARLWVLLRPPLPPGPRATISVGGIILNRRAHEVRRDDIPIRLRPKEFALLEYLMDHAGTLATRRALTSYAWPDRQNLWTNTVDVHIKHLRDKIDRPFNRQLIVTMHGLGYKLDAAPDTIPEETT